MSSLQQNWRRGKNRFCLEAREVGGSGGRERQGRKMAQCVHISINEGKKKKLSVTMDY
jgi:hypothetical protein